MKTICFNVMMLFCAVLFSGCGDDPKPANRTPDPVTVTTSVNGNSVEIQWTPANDPDGDAVTYDFVLDGNTVMEKLTETRYTLTDLNYETEYQGKIRAKDARGASSEASFSFTTGFLFMKSFEVHGLEFFLHYDENGSLRKIDTNGGPEGNLVRNGAGRVTNMAEFSYTYNSGGLMSGINNGSRQGTLQYDGKNRLVRLYCNYTSAGNIYVLTRDHSYNAADQLIRVKEHFYREGSSTHEYIRFDLEYDANGNVSRMNASSSSDDITYTPGSVTTYTYDNKKNPWYTILTQQTNFSPVGITGTMLIRPTMGFGKNLLFRTHWTSPNNLVRIDAVSTSGGSENVISYTYNDDGYPVASEDVFTIPSIPPITTYSRFYY
jgi:hypothetical protein